MGQRGSGCRPLPRCPPPRAPLAPGHRPRPGAALGTRRREAKRRESPTTETPSSGEKIIIKRQAKEAGQRLLFVLGVLLDGAQHPRVGGGAALLEPACGQVPVMLVLQAGVFVVQLGHLLLQLVYPPLLLLQQLLLRLDNLVQLLQVLRRLAGVLGGALHGLPAPFRPPGSRWGGAGAGQPAPLGT